MRILAGAVLAALSLVAAGAQAPPPTFPAQQRGPGDTALVARGNALYTLNCRACHGVDLRGGDLGGPNLLRSQLVLNDQAGEAIGPVVRAGRVPAGGGTAMPPLPMSDEDVKAVAEYIHSVAFTSQPQGAPPVGGKVELNLLVGNAGAGEKYFKAQCASCHSITGDLAGVATRTGGIESLQNSWVAGRRAGPPSDAARRTPRVTVVLGNGERVSGKLLRMDDFVVSLSTDSGDYRSFTRRGSAPRVQSVEVQDPLAQHRVLWTKLSNDDMHDVTAYLATLK
ncbi:MAG TPA: c-type cytochrome [Steroidobacteraceae bacterium]|nr:c-type cytochrome [Steroidobacteraceae bacterium]